MISAEAKKEEGGKKRKQPPHLKSKTTIKPDGLVAADGEEAHGDDPKYIDPRTQLTGNLTSRRYRSSGEHLKEEMRIAVNAVG